MFQFLVAADHSAKFFYMALIPFLLEFFRFFEALDGQHKYLTGGGGCRSCMVPNLAITLFLTVSTAVRGSLMADVVGLTSWFFPSRFFFNRFSRFFFDRFSSCIFRANFSRVLVWSDELVDMVHIAEIFTPYLCLSAFFRWSLSCPFPPQCRSCSR